MSQIVLTGDCTTTTALALAAAWPDSDEIVLVELDPRGGSLAGWFDVPLTPSLSTLVAATHSVSDGDHSPDLDALVRRTANGIRFVPAPFRSRESARAIVEARHTVLAKLQTITDVLMIDAGVPIPGLPLGEVLGSTDVAIVVHRQASSSPGAALVRLERLREHLDVVAGLCAEVIVAVIGSDPFDAAQIREHVDPDVSWIELADDPLAAATHAGRRGVSARRMERLPLSRSVRRLADEVRTRLPQPELSTNGERG